MWHLSSYCNEDKWMMECMWMPINDWSNSHCMHNEYFLSSLATWGTIAVTGHPFYCGRCVGSVKTKKPGLFSTTTFEALLAALRSSNGGLSDLLSSQAHLLLLLLARLLVAAAGAPSHSLCSLLWVHCMFGFSLGFVGLDVLTFCLYANRLYKIPSAWAGILPSDTKTSTLFTNIFSFLLL